MPQRFKALRLVLGDQLNHQHSWFNSVNESVLYVLMEVKPENQYVTHHIQKIAGIFTAMRHFAAHLRGQGHSVHYIRISDADNKHSFKANLQALASAHSIESIEFLEPDEYRLHKLLSADLQALGLPCRCADTEHFYTSRNELAALFKGKQRFLMETFYRAMRKKHQVLIDGDKPATGTWNYDKQNRNKLPKNHRPPEPFVCQNDVLEIAADIEKAGLSHIGKLDAANFIWPVTRQQALDGFNYFLEQLLPHFGTYQDALSTEFWSLYHSRISFAMNLKLISPREVVEAVEKQFRTKPDTVGIAQAEGFIRQILGWREYMRGIYWAHMPEYATLNYFEAQNPLPGWFWDGNTRMACLRSAIKQSLQFGYAHHIQRLMVTGNFALLAGVHPDEVDAWYLGIYVDAFDWVEITNTRGMSQFADGGIVGTKPYISSASYLHKMGDHCGNCYYKHSQKTGPRSCPFNSLYWQFIDQHRDKLAGNPRMSMMYRVWEKMDAGQRTELLTRAAEVLENVETL